MKSVIGFTSSMYRRIFTLARLLSKGCSKQEKNNSRRLNRDFARWIAALALGALALAVQAESDELHYRYVSLDPASLGLQPATDTFFQEFQTAAIINNGHVYGSIVTCTDVCLFDLAVYKHGVLTKLQPGIAYTANNHGIIGGSVLPDPVLFNEQAALFHGNKVTLIPRQPGEFNSHVMRLTDSGLAIVLSVDTAGNGTFLLYKHGQTSAINLGVTDVFGGLDLTINDKGIIVGTAQQSPPTPQHPFGIARAFRFSPQNGMATLLEPVLPDLDSQGVRINRRGEVLGYSFTAGKTFERIGVWDRDGLFHTYFIEGTKEIPTVSNSLLFNEKNLIVITATTDGNSYVVPEAGVRLNLADITDGVPPVKFPLQRITDMNDRGDLIGLNIFGTSNFLLKRVERERDEHGKQSE